MLRGIIPLVELNYKYDFSYQCFYFLFVKLSFDKFSKNLKFYFFFSIEGLLFGLY